MTMALGLGFYIFGFAHTPRKPKLFGFRRGNLKKDQAKMKSITGDERSRVQLTLPLPYRASQ